SRSAPQGPRPYMEDEFFLSSDGSFLAVFDGHGGAQVSKYLRKNLFRHFMENLSSNGSDAYDVKTVEQALRAAYQAVDKYVTTQTSFYNEGSCAVSVTVHCDRQGKVSLYLAMWETRGLCLAGEVKQSTLPKTTSPTRPESWNA
ncbi:unnamed protein product, partial [Ascophyllum nodosum]